MHRPPETAPPPARSLVVATQADAIALTGAGVPATTPATILVSDPAQLVGYFADSRPAVFVHPDLAEADTIGKLTGLGIPVKVVRP